MGPHFETLDQRPSACTRSRRTKISSRSWLRLDRMKSMTATPSGTRSYFEKLKKKGLNPATSTLGVTDLMVSRVGFGGYRVHEFDPDHREALRIALTSGCNIIDTSSNYTDGSSERLIGQVTSELFESGELRREEIVFVTKAGYVQGENLKLAKERAARGESFPDMVEFQPDCWHNISPEFLETQITNSLSRLKIQQIDVLLLHNPEYYLKSSGTRDVYYQRIEKAFRHLESERERGRIRYYGISSNTFPEDEARSDFTSLAKVIEIGRAVSGGSTNSHFAVVQMPFNLFESGAALLKNNNKTTVLELAEKEGLGVLINRPFNAIQKGRLVRLTSFPNHDPVEVKGGLHVALGRAIELEKAAPGYPKSAPGFQWAHVLRDRLNDLDDLLAWRDALLNQVYPSIRQALNRLNADRQAWANDYQATMQELLNLITADLENLANQKSHMIADQLVAAAPELASSNTLSQKVLRLYTGLPEISTILVGMRTPNYVKDVLEMGEPTSKQKTLDTLTKFLRHRS